MICPVDNNDMIVVEHKSIEMDYCLRCSGVWFDCGELELLLETTQSPEGKTCSDLVTREEAQTTETKRKCPVCGRKMDKVWLGKEFRVLIDSCPIGDGLWFDGGELSQVVGRSKPGEQDVISFLGDTFQANQAENKGPGDSI